MVAIDRMGKMIEPGHLVMFNSPEDLIFEVADVKPVLNPSVPGGHAITIVLQAQFPVHIAAAQPNRGFVVIGESKARLDAKAASNGNGHTAEAVQVEEPGGGPRLVLTDAPAMPSPKRAYCPACGSHGAAGDTCVGCGDSTYQRVIDDGE